VVIPSVPDLLSWRPLPDDLWCWCLLTPVADSTVPFVSLDKFETFPLSVKNMSVLLVDPRFGVSITRLIGSSDSLLVSNLILIDLNKGVLSDGAKVLLAKLSHLSILLKELWIDHFRLFSLSNIGTHGSTNKYTGDGKFHLIK